MPNLFSAAEGANSYGGYITNRMSTSSNAAVLTPTQSFQAPLKRQSPDEHWAITGTKILAAAPLDVVDSMAALFPGMERGKVNDTVYQSIGQPGFAQWVRDNQGGVEVASGILGAVAVGVGAEIAMTKLVGSAWFAATGVGRAAAPLTNMVSNAQKIAADATYAAAQAGNTLRWYQGANLAYVGKSVIANVAKASVSELAIAATLNKNSAVWSDDMSTNLLFGALGLGIGGGLGVVMSRGAINRWANSDIVAGAFADAADPAKYERMLGTIPLSGASTTLVPKVSSEITAFMLNARNDETISGATTSSARGAIKNEEEAIAHRLLQTMTTKGNPALPGSKFSVLKESPEGQHIVEALHEDPTILFGAASVGKLDPEIGVKTSVQQVGKQADDWLATKDPKLKLKGSTLKKQIPLVLVGRTLMTVDDAAPHTRFDPKKIEAKPTAVGIDELTWISPHSTAKLTLREDGHLNTPLHSLDIEDIHGVVEVANRIMDRMMRKHSIMIVPKNPTHFQLDMAATFETRGGTVNWAKAAGLTGIEEAKIMSLKLKKGIVSGTLGPLDSTLRFKLNLPQMTSVERIADPNGDVLKQVLLKADAPGVTTKSLAKLRQDAQRIFDFTSDIKAVDALDGDIFGFNRSMGKGGGTWHSPVLLMFDDTPASTWSRFHLGDQIVENKLIRYETLKGGKKAPLVAMVTKTMLESAEVRTVMNVSGLADSQIGGTGHIIGATGSQFLTQAHRFRSNPVLAGAQMIRRVVNRITEAYNDEMFKRLAPYSDQLASVSGQQSRILLNQYLSNSAGWDIASVTQKADGKLAFVLRTDSTTNQQRLGRPVQRGETLINERTGKEIVIDELGNATRIQLEKEFARLLDERNTVRAAAGLEPIRKRAFFTPPAKADKTKIVGYTLNAANKPVPGKAVVASSREEFASMRGKLEKELKPGERFLTLDEIKNHADLWEQAQMDFIDPTAMAAPAYHSKGTLASAFINPNAYENVLAYLKNGFEQTTNYAVRSVFDAQLKTAGIRGTAQQAVSGTVPGTKNIWTTYEETLLGIPGTRTPSGVSAVLTKVEDAVDAAVAAAWPVARVSTLHLQDVMDKIGSRFKLGKVKSFADLQNQLGNYVPFKDAMDYAEYTHGIVPPPEVKGVARTMNRIGSGVILRWLEVPHALMNMAGIITNMPAIVGARNVPQIGRVAGVPVIDSAKIMARGLRRMFRDAKMNSQDWAMMVRNGDTSQDVAELHMQLGLLKGKSRFMRMVTGDPNGKTLIARKGLEGMASIIADTSENWSRQISHFIGLELADYHGIVGLEARHNFARKIANDSIANYDPLNRPEIYQSAFGSMYGLFLSYAQNYYQRLFRWMEEGDFKSVGRNLAVQASMFGFMGLPGARQMADLIGGEEDGEGLVDGIYKRFGPATGSVIANGGFNQITTIFGLDPVALHTRGDANFRSPAIDFASSGNVPLPIGLEVLKDVSTGVFEAVGALVNPAIPNSGKYAAENLARNMPSRMLRGTISMLVNGGQEADAYGNLMSETQTASESVYRFMGLRSGRQQAEIDAYFTNQKAMAIDAQRLNGLRAATRALIRTGDFNRLPEVFDDYVNAGGKPWNYSQWIRGLITEATNTRGENQLLKSMRGPAHQDLARRIQLYTGAY